MGHGCFEGEFVGCEDGAEAGEDGEGGGVVGEEEEVDSGCGGDGDADGRVGGGVGD